MPVTDPMFVALCKAMQDGVFARFLEFERQHLSQPLQLLISGGLVTPDYKPLANAPLKISQQKTA